MHALFQNLISLIKMSHTKNEYKLLATFHVQHQFLASAHILPFMQSFPPLHSLSLLPKPKHIP